jgi:hypothetical protein
MTTQQKRKAAPKQHARIREVALEKFMAGNWFVDRDGQHRYFCKSKTHGGQDILIELDTPYRKWRIDGQLDYVLQIWLDKKVMNYEWDYAGNTALRFLKAGEWVDKVLSWKIKPLPANAPQRVAAE